MKHLSHIVDGIRRHSQYIQWAEDGRTPAAVKAHSVAVLGKYLNVPSAAGELPLPILAYEAVAIENLQRDSWSISMLTAVLHEFRDASKVDCDASLRAVIESDDAVVRAMSEFMSLVLMEDPKEDLAIEEFRLEVFRNIGGLIEACIKPHLHGLLAQVRIRRGKPATLATIQQLALGTVVQELSDTLHASELMAPPPWRLRLNQWRNIAQHHDSWVEGDEVVCRYDQGGSECTLRLNRDELLTVVLRIQAVLSIVRLGRSITILDHFDELGGSIAPKELRPEIALFQLAAAFASQGFEIADFSESADGVRLTVKDVARSGSTQERMLHSSQFVFPLWQAFPRPLISVTYLDHTGVALFGATARAQDCEAVYSGSIPFAELANRMRFDRGEARV